MTDQIAKGTITLGENFTQHRIRGYVPHAAMRGLPPDLDVPLISRVDLTDDTAAPIEGDLWQGGCKMGVRLPDGFDFVLSLYPWERYLLTDGCERLEVRMYDALDQGFEQVDELSGILASRLRDGDTVLVHCQAGLNRSGLLAAATLVKLGFLPAEAIARLRSARSPLVLCNEAFENWIAGLGD
jgi:protein-tyrosine phosphatase